MLEEDISIMLEEAIITLDGGLDLTITLEEGIIMQLLLVSFVSRQV
ncbi:hypothetical protein [Piscirickettsia salmonis]|nr:hypothetical protein [Piscirickettsia salmonis]QIX55932.1 hypothetical protein GW536_11325 [Piscirickettsia salmonis]